MRFPIDNLFEEMFNDFDDDLFAAAPRHPGHNLMRLPKPDMGLMRTDVKENKKNYQLSIELPGYKKDDVKVKLDKGVLTVSATRHEEKSDEKDGKIIRHERYFGSVSRSWYVGEELKQQDVKANYKNGILSLIVPKVEAKTDLPETDKYIAIEG